jgi:tRNA 2-thiocytidine biosynthesis protein TtcA
MDNINQVQKKLLASVRRADYDFGLIGKGDKILIGLSGGKDSLALVNLLSLYQKFAGKDFILAAAHLDFGFPPVDFSPVEAYVKSLGVRYITYPATDVYEILKVHRNPVTGLLPCSICSRMRKAVINRAANELGFPKVAFAHHMDDAIETLFLNMTFGARVATFEPKMYLENAGIEFIRPLIYAREKMIARYARMLSLPVTKNSCGNDKHTEREQMKDFLEKFYADHPDSYSNFAVMLTNSDSFKLWFDRYGPHPEDGLFIKKCSTPEDCLALGKIASSVNDGEKEDYVLAGSFYYLLRKKGMPIAYLKAKLPEDRKDFSFGITLFRRTPEATDHDCQVLIDTFEKNLSMLHVPTEVTFSGKANREVFLAFGYEEKDGMLRKTLTKSLKI